MYIIEYSELFIFQKRVKIKEQHRYFSPKPLMKLRIVKTKEMIKAYRLCIGKVMA